MFILTGDYEVVVANFSIFTSPGAGLRMVREGALGVTRSTLVANILTGVTRKVAVTFAAESVLKGTSLTFTQSRTQTQVSQGL